jgi:hypothetical protein
MFETKRNQPPEDGQNIPGFTTDQGRMNDIASRVEERLRFKSHETVVPLVHDFSELCSKYGEVLAAAMVTPVEEAITECGWIATTQVEFGKACRLQIVAQRPRSQSPET